jgi:glycerol-1-phosphate dehydrogenase [NAD(P)+]
LKGKKKRIECASLPQIEDRNAMNRWFETLQQTLGREKIPEDPKKAPLVPLQVYAESLGELREAFSRWVQTCLPADARIRVFVDGVEKKCSEGPTAQIDREFRALVSETGIPFRWTDLSAELSVPPRDIHASHACLERIRGVVREGKEDAVIVLGSGSITDLVKHALQMENITVPFVSIPTALTVTAFTSAFAVIDFHGAKRTLQSRPVSAAFWVRPFLECAPPRMSRAGFGDLLARFVAYGDWLLGYRLGVMERYDESAFRLMEPFAGGIRQAADGFAGDALPQEATACTAAALAMAGISMSTAGETTPLSGFEHVISHGLDFLRLTAGRELVFHGEQVALGSLVSARTIDRLLAVESLRGVVWHDADPGHSLQILKERMAAAPLPRSSPADPCHEKMEAALAEFSSEYRKKAERWAAARPRIAAFADSWGEIRRDLARVTLRAAELEPLLKKSGLPCRPGETEPSTTDGEFRWAVFFSPFVRSRMNLSDLLFWMGREDLVLLP